MAAEVANGEVIGNHTWDHPSLTGKATGTRPLSQAQVRDQLTRANAAIVTVGAPEPSLWRPPYGGVNAADVATARVLGLRVVLDSGDNIIDSNDWDGLSAQQIARRVDPRLRDGTIIAFHDGLRTAAPATIRALPLIVAYMNAHHLGATTAVRPDATGGVVPYPGARPAGRTHPAGGTTLPPRRLPLPAAPQPATSSPAPATGTEPGTPTAPARHRAPPPPHPRPARARLPRRPARPRLRPCRPRRSPAGRRTRHREHACAGHDQPRTCAHGRPVMAPGRAPPTGGRGGGLSACGTQRGRWTRPRGTGCRCRCRPTRPTGHGSWPATRPGSRTAWRCPVQPDPSYDPVPDLAALLRVLHWARPIGLAYPGSAADLHDRVGEITDFPAQIWQA